MKKRSSRSPQAPLQSPSEGRKVIESDLNTQICKQACLYSFNQPP